MDKTKNRFFIRVVDKKSDEVRLPLCKKRTVLRAFFRLMLGTYDYMEIVNEAYLDNKESTIKKDKSGNLVRGFSGGTKRQQMYGEVHNEKVYKFKEGLYDPETNEGYVSKEYGLTIQPFCEEQLDNTMTLIELMNEDDLDYDDLGE